MSDKWKFPDYIDDKTVRCCLMSGLSFQDYIHVSAILTKRFFELGEIDD